MKICEGLSCGIQIYVKESVFKCKVLSFLYPEAVKVSQARSKKSGREKKRQKNCVTQKLPLNLSNLKVTYYDRLLPKDNGTELLLEHTGFSGFDNFSMFSAMNDGWFKNIQKIAELIKSAK